MISRICSLLRIKQPELNRGFLFASGTTVPIDGTDGYQTGAVFQKTDGGGGTALYINEGSVTSSDFNAVDAGAIDVSLDVGVFSSLTAGDGIALSSSDRSAVAIYGDDAGLSIASSVYNLRTRLLLTVDQDGASIRALMAQLKLADGVDVSTGVYTASQGYVELAGDTSVETGATFSCFDASLEIASGKTLTIDSGGVACGLRIETTGAGTISNSGTCAGILVEKASGAAEWPVGIYMPGPDVTTGLRIGDWIGAAATTAGVLFGTDMDVYSDGQLDVMQVHGATDSLINGSYSLKCGRFRHVVQVSGTLEAEAYGLVGQVVAKTVVFGLYAAGLMGTIESNGGFHAGDGASASYPCQAGVIGRPGGSSITVDSGAVLAGIAALSNTSSISATGDYAGLFVGRCQSSTDAFGTGLLIQDSAATTGVSVGACAGAGVAVTGAWGAGYNTAGILIAADQAGAAVALGSSDSGWCITRTNVTAAATTGSYIFGEYVTIATSATMVDGFIMGKYVKVNLAHVAYENYAIRGRMCVDVAQTGNTGNQYLGLFGAVEFAAGAHALRVTGGGYGVLGTASIASGGTIDQPLIGGYFECNAVDTQGGSVTTASRHRMLGYCNYGVDVLCQTTNNVAGIRVNPDDSAKLDVGILFEGSSGGNITHAFKFAANDKTEGAYVAEITFDATSDGMIKIDVAGTDYYIPFWNAAGLNNEWAD